MNQTGDEIQRCSRSISNGQTGMEGIKAAVLASDLSGRICNLLDVVLVGGMLVILDMGSTSVQDSNPVSNTVVVTWQLHIISVPFLYPVCLC